MSSTLLKYFHQDDVDSFKRLLANISNTPAGQRSTGGNITPKIESSSYGSSPSALLRNKSAYYDALNQVQLRGEWGPWMDMLCQAVVESAHDAISIADEWNVSFGNTSSAVVASSRASDKPFHSLDPASSS